MATATTTTDATYIDTGTTSDEVLLAATNHDIEVLRTLLKKDPTLAKVQDADTGFSPLHAAIASCEADEDEGEHERAEEKAVNGEGDAVNNAALDEDGALATVKLLFENGAIWNELDTADETPGCLALRLGLNKVYETIVDAGVRAELLFGRLDQYDLLGDGDDEAEEEEQDDDAIVRFEPSPVEPRQKAPWQQPNGTANGVEAVEGFEPAPNPSYKIEDEAEGGAAQPSTATAVESTAEEKVTEPALSNPNVNNADYLKSELTYSGDRLLDSDKNAVMMDWETEIMKTSADQLAHKPGLRTMNVGHGMGIVDRMFLENQPSMHHICEAHPAVIQRLKETGWYDKPNVTVHEGRWQDVLPKLVEQGVVLDGIYYDTYAEDYKDLKEFFTEYVIALLEPDGKFGFYNGLGADRQVCYDVYTKVVEVDLFDAGLDVEWTDIAVPDLKSRNEWDGVRYPYWGSIKTYRLPTCKFVG
ncbi:Arginine N-methyltransferase 2 [Friedmanniomyces endolithicus]|uniref:Arginine N-methyltransferase 2 n=1 Tax=Friedmanniomyces endolithicus TaxID=329885 RepID=A0AAN6KZJ7_9PEZI|nr:Arginine N-methyltransferase 2 [Friedmanniomyces endolithicus]KAK0963709.1 Arginine N-methyltransferase 2 [Friedmanniomyces endolithicus]KAK1011746.1 Arginine N-methyltransferase 2 [Friedmanniomyces endolithicus]KAK1030378.1 Arginine N-methyltransferase 2 [Friedmanniomyces endolithicus]